MEDEEGETPGGLMFQTSYCFTLGRLARSSGALTAECVEFEVKRALEWLQERERYPSFLPRQSYLFSDFLLLIIHTNRAAMQQCLS